MLRPNQLETLTVSGPISNSLPFTGLNAKTGSLVMTLSAPTQDQIFKFIQLTDATHTVSLSTDFIRGAVTSPIVFTNLGDCMFMVAAGSEWIVVGGTATPPYYLKQSARVAAVTAPSGTSIAGTTIALSTSNTYTDAAVNTAVNAAIVTLKSQINNAFTDEINKITTVNTALNAILTSIKAANLMAGP